MRVILKGIAALALILTISLGAVEAIGFLVRQIGHQMFHGINPTVAAAAVAAISTTTVAVATLVIGRYFERRKTIEADIRASKIPTYSRLVSGLLGVFQSKSGPEQQAAAEALFRDLTPDLITWASDEVLIAWSRFKRDIPNLPPEEAPFALEKVLMAIRRDYGHRGLDVKEGDLLGLFITDVDEVLAKRRKASTAAGRGLPSSE